MMPNLQYDPGSVFSRPPQQLGKPYLNNGTQPGSGAFNPNLGAPHKAPMPGPPQMMHTQIGVAQPKQGVLGSEAIRATGQGPFDQSFRQNLATYAGGQFQRPGGQLSFNPTSPINFGSPVGGGNAPVLGMPQTLTGQALGGSPFSWAPPVATTGTQGRQLGGPAGWLDQWLRNSGFNGGMGRNFALNSI